MIKFAVAALWISAATLGSVYYSFNAARTQGEEAQAEPTLLGGLDYVSVEMVSVPLLKQGTVHGYFLAKLVYTIEPEKKAKLVLPADKLLLDQLYTYLYANPQIDFTKKASLDLDAFRSGIRDAVNAHVGDKLVHEVLIEQLDYLTKEDIRDNTARRRKVIADMEAAVEASKSKKASPQAGH